MLGMVGGERQIERPDCTEVDLRHHDVVRVVKTYTECVLKPIEC